MPLTSAEVDEPDGVGVLGVLDERRRDRVDGEGLVLERRGHEVGRDRLPGRRLRSPAPT